MHRYVKLQDIQCPDQARLCCCIPLSTLLPTPPSPLPPPPGGLALLSFFAYSLECSTNTILTSEMLGLAQTHSKHSGLWLPFLIHKDLYVLCIR